MNIYINVVIILIIGCLIVINGELNLDSVLRPCEHKWSSEKNGISEILGLMDIDTFFMSCNDWWNVDKIMSAKNTW